MRPSLSITFRPGRARAAAWALAALLVPSAWALDPHKAITQFHHQSWRAAEGIGAVRDIAQTADGYLWLSTSYGVYRFDGMRFERLEANLGELTNPVVTTIRMLGSRDGALWLTYGSHLVRWQDGTQRSYAERDGLVGGIFLLLHESQDGAIWAGSDRGLSRLSDGRWKRFGADEGLPEGRVRTLFEDRDQNLWVGMELAGPQRHVFYLLPHGGSTFKLCGDAGLRSYEGAQAPDGKIWVAQLSRSVRGFVPSPNGIQFESPEVQVGSIDIRIDRDGTLWITTVGDGLRRVRNTRSMGSADIGQHSDAVDKFTQKDGLSNDYVMCVFEGREGEIWVGTSSGLDCFRETKFTAITMREGLPANPTVLQAAADGRVLVGATPRGFAWIEETGARFVDLSWSPVVETAAYKRPENRETVTCLFADPGGKLLAGAGVGLVSISEDGREFSLVPGTEELGRIEALSRDGSGTLWISDHDLGLWRLEGDRLEKVPEALRAPIDSCLPAAHTDGQGRVWFAVNERRGQAGHLLCYEQGKFRRYFPQEAHFPSAVFTIFSDAKGQVWFAGQGGLSRFVEGRFETLTRRHGIPDDVLSAAIQDDEGYFWLAGASGVFRVAAQELERVLAADSGQARGELFSVDDGLRGFVQSLAGVGGSVIPVKGPDGRLWFPTSAGVATIHPRRIHRNPRPPPVHIQRIVAASVDYPVAGPLVFPVGTRDCEIDYVGICFSNPTKVRYRYRLEGYDQHWVEAGSRRQAFYSNLEPGAYRFRVAACNNDGVWNEAGAAVDFSVTPAFYETRWFPAAMLLPVGLALWGLHRLRLSQLSTRMNLRLESQAVERRRIARELHDTILQGFIGVGLKLDAIAATLPESLAPTREQLRRILDQADHYLAEARRSVSELRSPSLGEGEAFTDALTRAAERLVEGTVIRLEFRVDGIPRKLAPELENHLLRVGEEAVSNAVRHARPHRIQVSLAFEPTEVSLQIKDDGVGFESQDRAARPGHFGLVGLQERAEAMGGRVAVSSSPGQGTEVSVTVPTA